ncbi:MAG: hypothetical protein Q9159_000250 [Coniocarpon cinnabarinum]
MDYYFCLQISSFLILTFFSLFVCYRWFLDGLHKYPGPRLWAVTQFPWFYINLSGRINPRLDELHKKHGSVVRIGPNELSYAATDLQTWKTITARKPKEMLKNLGGSGIAPSPAGRPGILEADTRDHARMRKSISPAFAERALRGQEQYINVHVNRFMSIVSEQATSNSAIDIAKLFNLTTFDVIGDLSFGESFGGLEKRDYHPWVGTILNSLKRIPYIQLLVYYGVLRNVAKYQSMLIPKKLDQEHWTYWNTVKDKVNARLDRKTDRSDFMGFILADSESNRALDQAELYLMASTLTIGGSESAATHLSSVVFYLLQNPEAMKRARKEVRASFASERDINIQSSGQGLQYLRCVSQECFRIHPPAPSTFPRVVPDSGETIDGQWVPGGTVVGINHWSTYHFPDNFHNAHKFVPERWLPIEQRPKEYHDDHLEVVQPFSYGNRNCVGLRLAEAEIRLILCRLFFSFDLEAAGNITDWPDQRAWLAWERKPLNVLVKRREVSKA